MNSLDSLEKENKPSSDNRTRKRSDILLQSLSLPTCIVTLIEQYVENGITSVWFSMDGCKRFAAWFDSTCQIWQPLVLADSQKFVHKEACYPLITLLNRTLYVLEWAVDAQNTCRFRFECFEFGSSEWVLLPLPTSIPAIGSLLSAQDSIFYIAEASNLPDNVWCQSYSPVAKRWSLLTTPEAEHYQTRNSPVVHGDRIYFLGGLEMRRANRQYVSYRITNRCRAYNCKTKSWVDLPSLPSSSNEHLCVSLPQQNKIIVLGGYSTLHCQGSWLNVIRTFDVEKNSWSQESTALTETPFMVLECANQLCLWNRRQRFLGWIKLQPQTQTESPLIRHGWPSTNVATCFAPDDFEK